MSRPKVGPKNRPATYEFYRGFEPNQRLAKIGYYAMSKIANAEVYYEGNARAQTGELLDAGAHFILVNNHTSIMDALTIAGLAHSQRVLRCLRGRTVIPSKDSLFKNPVLRRGIDIMGAIPTFRDDSPEAAQGITDTVIYLMNERGKALAIDAEGKRNKGDPREMLKLKKGVGHIGLGLSQDRPLLTLPVGISYGEGSDKNLYKPVACIGEPRIGHPTNPTEYVEMLRVDVQRMVDWAFEITDERAANA